MLSVMSDRQCPLIIGLTMEAHFCQKKDEELLKCKTNKHLLPLLHESTGQEKKNNLKN